MSVYMYKTLGLFNVCPYMFTHVGTGMGSVSKVLACEVFSCTIYVYIYYVCVCVCACVRACVRVCDQMCEKGSYTCIQFCNFDESFVISYYIKSFTHQFNDRKVFSPNSGAVAQL